MCWEDVDRDFPPLSGFGVNDNMISGVTLCLSIINIFKDVTRLFEEP